MSILETFLACLTLLLGRKRYRSCKASESNKIEEQKKKKTERAGNWLALMRKGSLSGQLLPQFGSKSTVTRYLLNWWVV